ncbi:hypothetical protein BKA62DRAFT_706547 [Auriculariales sp. MPI-PUGE-AT-0066]|nr:hypothetical protein BKA62DRAFT_706547 [Auriculariales sp. MPI-PUGE-AT-0066]
MYHGHQTYPRPAYGGQSYSSPAFGSAAYSTSSSATSHAYGHAQTHPSSFNAVPQNGPLLPSIPSAIASSEFRIQREEQWTAFAHDLDEMLSGYRQRKSYVLNLLRTWDTTEISTFSGFEANWKTSLDTFWQLCAAEDRYFITAWTDHRRAWERSLADISTSTTHSAATRIAEKRASTHATLRSLADSARRAGIHYHTAPSHGPIARAFMKRIESIPKMNQTPPRAASPLMHHRNRSIADSLDSALAMTTPFITPHQATTDLPDVSSPQPGSSYQGMIAEQQLDVFIVFDVSMVPVYPSHYSAEDIFAADESQRQQVFQDLQTLLDGVFAKWGPLVSEHLAKLDASYGEFMKRQQQKRDRLFGATSNGFTSFCASNAARASVLDGALDHVLVRAVNDLKQAAEEFADGVAGLEAGIAATLATAHVPRRGSVASVPTTTSSTSKWIGMFDIKILLHRAHHNAPLPLPPKRRGASPTETYESSSRPPRQRGQSQYFTPSIEPASRARQDTYTRAQRDRQQRFRLHESRRTSEFGGVFMRWDADGQARVHARATAFNEAMAELREDMVVKQNTCRGNWSSLLSSSAEQARAALHKQQVALDGEIGAMLALFDGAVGEAAHSIGRAISTGRR